MNRPTDIYQSSMAQQNWMPSNSASRKSGSSDNRNEKRSRIGNRQDRAITKSAKGHLHPKWPALCAKAYNLNK